uniref:Uncharacterized protein n=1 Tax=Nothobranchius pienaari TaxID=704102 RepID=A0A1A8NDY7_9TELE
MYSGESLMEFVTRQVATAREIIAKVEEAMAPFEEGLGGQRRLSDMSWKPQSSSHRADLPQHHVCEKKELTVQQLFNQELISCSDQEEPEQLKLFQHEGQLLNQENLTFTDTPLSEETDCHEPEPNRNQPLCQSSTESENQDRGGCRKENSESNGGEELKLNKRRQRSKEHRESVGGEILKKKRAHKGVKKVDETVKDQEE